MHQSASTAASDSRTVVVGSRSFIGAALMARLVQNGASVLGLSSNDVDLRAADAADQLCERLRATDCLVMAAGIAPGKPPSTSELVSNACFARAVAEAVRRQPVAHLIYLSSDAVYPDSEECLTEASCASSESLYGTSHRLREAILSCTDTVACQILRCTMVYGAGDTHDAYGPNRMVRTAIRERRIELFGEGEDVRDYLAIDDLVDLLERVLAARSQGVLNAASGEPISARALADRIALRCGPGIECVERPRSQAASARRFDVTALRRAFPSFAPRPIDQGIDELVGALLRKERASQEPPASH